MGSPKAIKNIKQSFWSGKIGVSFVVGLVIVILTCLALSEQFARGPNALSQFTPVHVDKTRRPMRDKPSSTDQELEADRLSDTRLDAPKQEGGSSEKNFDAELKESPNKEVIKTPDQEEKTEKFEPKESPKNSKPSDETPTQEEKSTEGSKPPKKEDAIEGRQKPSPALDQEGESPAKSGAAPYNKCKPPPPGKLVCDLSNPRFDLCELCGDARTVGQSSTVVCIPSPPERHTSDGQEWSIRAQSRKHLPWVKKVTVKSLNASQPAPQCTSKLAVPAIVFALGGLTANAWHDFSDVLIPLFLTAREFNGDVQLLITNNQPWFVEKYRAIFNLLTRHDIVDFDADVQVRCYPHVIVGLRSHQDLSIDPNYSPQHYTMVDFRLFVREAYGLPAGADIPYRADKDDPDKKPRVMLINRGKTRRFMNAPHVVQGLEWFGFDVVTADPKVDAKLDEFVRLVDSCDAIMGVHGAGLTNMAFLRSGAVVVQVVPYGIEFMADVFYGAPARDMGLRHVQYNISAEESTLLEKYGWNHTVIKDPEAIKKSGWDKVGEFYMSKQDIVLNMTRFGPSLMNALEFIM